MKARDHRKTRDAALRTFGLQFNWDVFSEIRKGPEWILWIQFETLLLLKNSNHRPDHPFVNLEIIMSNIGPEYHAFLERNIDTLPMN